jgi:prolyl-tRNA editing enzyme YbaK/EbsC (Cys-tRNA(Pro) deacylase)
MSPALSKSAQRVQDILNEHAVSFQVVELPQSTRTAVEAAGAIGCQVEQIVKSLVFRGKATDRPILVIASGVNRVSEERVAQLVGEPIGKANAEFVRERTGFAIGGVPPVGHIERLETVIDEDLLQYAEIWAAAGTPHAVFRLTPADLTRMAGGHVAQISE